MQHPHTHEHNIYIFTSLSHPSHPHTLTSHTYHISHYTPSHTTLPHSYPNGWHWCDCWSTYNPLHKVQRSSSVIDPCDHLPPPHPPNANVFGSLPYTRPSRSDSRISRWVSVGGGGGIREICIHCSLHS